MTLRTAPLRLFAVLLLVCTAAVPATGQGAAARQEKAGALVQETPGQGTPGQGPPVEETLGQETPGQGTPAEGPADQEPARPETPGPTDPAEVEAFVDGLMAAYLEVHDVAGATVSVVRDGELIFAKGYGEADVESGREVAAETTLFRIGSISKLFVWTAVMQLAEAGELDLDTDVNEYLTAVRIPDTYEEPVTLTHLMTHTAGFEDRIIGLFARDEEALRPLEEVLADELPARVRPPGQVASYSNHGTGIAAHIVEEVSGMAWNEYVEERILGPLGMEHTTFRQPVPERLEEHLSHGYSHRGGKFDDEGFEFIPLAPAGAASASATDMARFMTAHLQEGRYGEARILEEETARRMRQELFRHAPAVNPMAYGFIDASTHGQRVIGHGGDTLLFHSLLLLVPEHELGAFVSFNSEGGGAATGQFAEAFMDRYFPVEGPRELTPPEGFEERAGRFEGHYRANRYAHTTLAKLAALGAVSVESTGDGALRTSATGRTRWIEVEPLAFREEDGADLLVFREDDRGEITHVFMGDLPILAFERLAWWETPPVQLLALAFSVIVFLGTLVLWPAARVVRWRLDRRPSWEERLPLFARVIGWSGAAVWVAFLVGTAFVLEEPRDIVFGLPGSLSLLLWLPLIAGVLALGALAYAALVWKDGRGTLWRRTWYTLLTLALFVALALAWYWNLLGFRY